MTNNRIFRPKARPARRIRMDREGDPMRIKRIISCLLALCLLTAGQGAFAAGNSKKKQKKPAITVLYNGNVTRRYT